jgi:V/A-type H+-transporting ATPase subunit A
MKKNEQFQRIQQNPLLLFVKRPVIVNKDCQGMSQQEIVGEITRIAGPLVQATGMLGVRLYDVARIGNLKLIGEIIKIDGDIVSIQCYENTDGIFPGEPVVGTGEPLSVLLGPGLMSQIYDGIQRPLPSIKEQVGNYITRGVETPALDMNKKWDFKITAKVGDQVVGGDIIATVQETPSFLHKIMIPPNLSGKLTKVEKSGNYNIQKTLAVLEDENGTSHDILGYQVWPVRIARPFKNRLASDEILITGQRIFDTFFPISKGGVAAVPGPFGTGKCMHGDTPVLLADGTKVPIRELFEQYENKGTEEQGDANETIIRLNKEDEIQVIGFNPDNYGLEITNATHVYKGVSDHLIRINTKSGRDIKVTPIHKLQTYDYENTVEKQAMDIKVGENLLIPKNFNIDFEDMSISFDHDIDVNQNQLVMKSVQKMDILHQRYNFDPIVKIELIEGPMEVFDLTVPSTNRFLAGEKPLIVHNTVTQHSLAKFSDAQVVVYVGCGERGNEMTNVLEEFPHLKDPETGLPLIARTTMIANTSNMPVAAREASVYTGVTMAEYLRDQGYDVSMMADSTSRWAEAMREISGRLEEMPGEGGYPAYLGSKVAAYYERGGKVVCEGSDERVASISIVGAVSPPGGDFSEPVTQNTLRIVKAFWALTKKLAEQRHFPAISYLESYTLYWDVLEPDFRKKFAEDFGDLRGRAFRLLQEDNDLQEIVQLVGPDALPPAERITLEAARVLKEDYLQQNAFHEVDQYCSPEKQTTMLRNIFVLYDKMRELYDAGVELEDITGMEIFDKVARMKYEAEVGNLKELQKEMNEINPEQFTIIQV